MSQMPDKIWLHKDTKYNTGDIVSAYQYEFAQEIECEGIENFVEYVCALSIWKSADGDDLPEIDREVIALLEDGKVVFAHRPPEYWNGKNIITNEVTRYEPKRYDKGEWNQPNVKWWLDLDLPKIEK